MIEESNNVMSFLNNFSSAKIKINELFLEFLKSEGSSKIINLLLDSTKEGAIDINKLHISSINGSLYGTLSPLKNENKKSPKKRCQSEMLSNSLMNESIPSISENQELTKIVDNKFSRLNLNLNESDDQMDISTQPYIKKESKMSEPTNFTDKIPQIYPLPPNKKKVQPYLFNLNNHHPFSQQYSTYFSQLSLTEDNSLSKKKLEIESFFKPYPNGIPVDKFVHVTKRLCGIPSFFNLPLCKRILDLYSDDDSVMKSSSNSSNNSNINNFYSNSTLSLNSRHSLNGVRIKYSTFLKFWEHEIEPYDRIERFFNLIKQPQNNYISKDDFVPFLQELLHFHPGLEFLDSHEEFQKKYALTVITRIFYKVNTSRTGKITLKEIRKSDLFSSCMHVDEETDINKVYEYFSYEHFYVIYCKFFELDSDKDSKINKLDLLKYNDFALNDIIIDRILQVHPQVFSDGLVIGSSNSDDSNSIGMSYPDFIYFMLNEEDKTNENSLRYWFQCLDYDGNNEFISPEIMRYFYYYQINRINSSNNSANNASSLNPFNNNHSSSGDINFQDVLCQMMDMVNPSNGTILASVVNGGDDFNYKEEINRRNNSSSMKINEISNKKLVENKILKEYKETKNNLLDDYSHLLSYDYFLPTSGSSSSRNIPFDSSRNSYISSLSNSSISSSYISLNDLLKHDKKLLSGSLYDVLLNVHKFLRFESRDPFQEKLRREDISHTDWDRYAYVEYRRLADDEDEEEEEDESYGGHHYNNSILNNDGGGISNDNSGYGNEDFMRNMDVSDGAQSFTDWSLNDEDD